MKLSEKRRQAIYNALAAGHIIRRVWSGSSRNGRLMHLLEGVPRLREIEVEILQREGLIRVTKPGEDGYNAMFKALRLSDAGLAAIEAAEGKVNKQ